MNQQSSDQHYSEADLLETYYMQPGASMPVMMHLADCTDCATRYERLEKKVRGLSSCAHDDKPESFWARQRIAVMRKVGAKSRTFSTRAFSTRTLRIAASALLVAALGGWMTSQQFTQPQPAPVIVHHAPEITVQVTSPVDPWESEELDEFHSIVAWESWDTAAQQNGDHS
jgi:anti-sigma factor RsiW